MTRSAIEQMLAEEAQAKVFKKIIAKYQAKDLGGSSDVDEDIAVRTRIELNKLETWGMNVEIFMLIGQPMHTKHGKLREHLQLG